MEPIKWVIATDKASNPRNIIFYLKECVRKRKKEEFVEELHERSQILPKIPNNCDPPTVGVLNFFHIFRMKVMA